MEVVRGWVDEEARDAMGPGELDDLADIVAVGGGGVAPLQIADPRALLAGDGGEVVQETRAAHGWAPEPKTRHPRLVLGLINTDFRVQIRSNTQFSAFFRDLGENHLLESKFYNVLHVS